MNQNGDESLSHLGLFFFSLFCLVVDFYNELHFFQISYRIKTTYFLMWHSLMQVFDGWEIEMLCQHWNVL